MIKIYVLFPGFGLIHCFKYNYLYFILIAQKNYYYYNNDCIVQTIQTNINIVQ